MLRHFIPRNDNRACAFTLAEVLITLVIIGVIAALTIPNLMQSWRKHERITQIKTAYSIIQNAIKLSIAENGNPDGWDFERGTDAARKYILPYLKVQYECGSWQPGNEILRNKGCFKDNNYNGTWYYLNGDISGTGTGYTAPYYYNVKLQNGMDLGIWATARGNQTGYKYAKYLSFVFDVNGAQGPTKAGVDVFAFVLYTDINKVVTMAPSNYHASTNWQGMLTTTNANACDVNAERFSGMGCARVIELNNWNFPDNYPVKKF